MKMDTRQIYTLRNLYRLIRDVENWQDVLLAQLGIRGSCVVHFTSGTRIRYVPQFFQLSLFSRHEDPFSFIDVAGRDVLDVGAAIGDTAIHFALKGARKVIGLEPFPSLFREAVYNVGLNRLDNVVLLNRALAGKEGPIKIPFDYVGDLSNRAQDFGQGAEVECVTLKQIVEDFQLRSAVLKMNCEGCEYDSILNSGEAVLAFNDIILFYHHGRELVVDFLTAKGFMYNVIFDHPTQGTLHFYR